MKGETDPKSLWPSGTSALRRPRLAGVNAKQFKPAKVGVIKPIQPKMSKAISPSGAARINFKVAKLFK